MGGVAAVGLLLMRAERAEEYQKRADAYAQAQAAAMRAAAQEPEVPPDLDPHNYVNPPAKEGPPTDLGPDREPEKDGKWTILFRSDEPAYWDTTGNADHYAVPLRKAPAGTAFLRMRWIGGGGVMILPVTTAQLKLAPTDEGGATFWNGTNAIEHGARHLGVAESVEGRVAITTDAHGATAGTGFGHKRGVEGAGQRYTWGGEEVQKPIIEIAVTDQPLTADEENLLVGRIIIDPNDR